MLVQYDGTRYNGWQKQGDTDNTIQQKLENILGIEEFMKDYGISVGSSDEPMMDAFKLMLENDAFYNQFMHLMISQYDRYSLFVPAGNYETAYPTNVFRNKHISELI